jgi:hypothetical protein
VAPPRSQRHEEAALKTIVCWVVPALLLAAVAGTAWAQRAVQVEKLEPVRCTEGATAPVQMVEAGFATPGQFGGDVVVHWFGMENPGAVLRFRVPVAAAGRYKVTVGVAKSWDYGLYQGLIDGVDAGPQLDLASAKEPEHVHPLVVDLGTHDLGRPAFELGFRFEGASPNTQEGPNPMSGGFDWVRLTPAPARSGAKAK